MDSNFNCLHFLDTGFIQYYYHMKTIPVAMATAPSSSSSSHNGGRGGGRGGDKKIERQGLERRAPRARPRRRIRPIIITPKNDDETLGTGDDFDVNVVPKKGKEDEEEQQKKKNAHTQRKQKKKKKKTKTLEERVEGFASDPLSALASINRIAIGAVDELMVERKGNPSKLLEALSRNAPRLLLMEDNRNGAEEMAKELEMELERLEKKGAKATREVRETLVKPNVDGETYERLFAYPGEDDESEDDEDEDDEDDDSEGFYDASKDTGSDEEVAKAASDIADALSGMDLADLYAEKKEDESKGKDEGGRRLNVIAESDSRKAEKEGISQEAVEYAIEENMSNVVMETATVSATRRRVSSATTASMTTPTTTSEISNKYYGSNDVMEQEQEQQEQQEEEQEEVEKQTMDSVVKDNSSYLQKLNGEWKRDDQLDESKLMDLFEMNQLFRAANSALTQLNVGASTSEFSLKASYGIISINESYAYDEEVRQNRRDARSGTQFGRATLDARSESITLDSRWTEPLEGTMTETFTVENNRLLRKAKVTLLQSQETWEGVYEYKRV